VWPLDQSWKKPRFLKEKVSRFLGFLKVFEVFLGFLDFSVEIRLDTKFPPRKNILYTTNSLSEHFL